jgi:O-antigen ligase
VAAISAVSLIKGHSQPRLEGVIGGIYSNPNDLAFAIVLTLPFCLAFLLSTKRTLVKFCWAGGILIMAFTLFKTASRAGFITLLISGAVCLWHFGVKGRRFYLIAASALAVVLLLAVAGGPLVRRMAAIGGKGDTEAEALAYDSYEARKDLMSLALHGIARYPILGMGTGDFQVYSGSWHDVHVAYLQIAVEGGIPSLILYLLFFGSGFKNLRELLRRRDLDPNTTLFVGALNSSLVGFVIGALFAPEAYEFFPYFAVAYTSALLAMVREREPAPETDSDKRDWRSRYGIVRADAKKPRDFTVVR